MKIKTKDFLIIPLLAISLFVSCDSSHKSNHSNADNMELVTIGSQNWTKINLNVDCFQNGNKIIEAKTDAEWTKAGEQGTPAWCYYDNNPTNGVKFGRLYNWYAVSDKRGLAPKGFHVPTADEWKELFSYLGNGWVAGDKIRDTSNKKLDLTKLTNSSGFSALPSGYRYDPCHFYAIGDNASWWTSSDFDKYNAQFCDLDFNMLHTVSSSNCEKVYGLSVRCIKDK